MMGAHEIWGSREFDYERITGKPEIDLIREGLPTNHQRIPMSPVTLYRQAIALRFGRYVHSPGV